MNNEIKITEESLEESHVELGLAILEATSPPYTAHTCETIGAYCGCSPAYVHQVERRAIEKLRKAFQKMKLGNTELER